jgi:hypothetical protein
MTSLEDLGIKIKPDTDDEKKDLPKDFKKRAE